MSASDFCLAVVLGVLSSPLAQIGISLSVACWLSDWSDRRCARRVAQANAEWAEAERARIAAIPTPVFDRLVAEGWRRRAASDDLEPIVVSREDYRAVRAELWEKRFFPVEMMMQWTPRSPFIVCDCVEVRCA